MRKRDEIEADNELTFGDMTQERFPRHVLEVLLDIRDLLKSIDIGNA
jgi:hypothetical protein